MGTNTYKVMRVKSTQRLPIVLILFLAKQKILADKAAILKRAINEKFSKFGKLPKGSTTKDAIKAIAKNNNNGGVIVLDNGSKIYTATSGKKKDKIRGLDPKKLLKVNGDKAVAEIKNSAPIF